MTHRAGCDSIDVRCALLKFGTRSHFNINVARDPNDRVPILLVIDEMSRLVRLLAQLSRSNALQCSAPILVMRSRRLKNAHHW